MRERQDSVGMLGRASGWFRTRRVSTAGLVVIFMFLIGILFAGYRTKNAFARDFFANLAADGLVALAVFLVANRAFGLWERRRQELDALRMAHSMLEEELTANRDALSRVVSGLSGTSRPPETFLMDGPPPIEKRNWQLVTDIPAATRLPVDLFLTLHRSYDQCEKLISRDWYKRATTVYIKSDVRGGQALVDDALPHFKTALEATDEALARLATAPQQK